MGASTMGHDQMVDEIAKVRELTAKPFGVDLLTAAPRRHARPGQRHHRRRRPRVFVAGLGVPRDVVELCHRSNVLVVNMCGKVRHAIAAVEAGCDIVVAQGTEAGGHTGQVATMALVPQVVDAVGDRVPVVAAGGIVRRARPGRRAGPRRRRRLGGHPLHRHARGPRRRRLQGRAARAARGRHGRHAGRTPARPAGWSRNSYTQAFEDAGGTPEPFPMQVVKSIGGGRLMPLPPPATWAAS